VQYTFSSIALCHKICPSVHSRNARNLRSQYKWLSVFDVKSDSGSLTEFLRSTNAFQFCAKAIVVDSCDSRRVGSMERASVRFLSTCLLIEFYPSGIHTITLNLAQFSLPNQQGSDQQPNVSRTSSANDRKKRTRLSLVRSPGFINTLFITYFRATRSWPPLRSG